MIERVGTFRGVTILPATGRRIFQANGISWVVSNPADSARRRVIDDQEKE